MADSDKNLEEAAKRQLVHVAVSGSGVVTKSGKRSNDEEE